MTEQLDDEQSADLNVEKYLGILKRRHIYFLLPLFFGWLLVWGASWFLPTKYKSSTLILVKQPTMPANYVAPNVTDNLQDHLQSITQQILSRTRLLMIIERLNLYSDASAMRNPDDKVDAMRKAITVDLVENRNSDLTAFRINFSAHDPVLAQKVTYELTQLFINENNRVRQQESQGTTTFIEKQLEDASAELAIQEAKVKQFEAAHEGSLPSQEASNLQILGGLQNQLQNQQDALNTAKQQRVYYQSLIEQYKTLHAAGRTVNGEPTTATAIDQELAKLRTQLTDLSSRYTDSYPDVVKLKAQIVKTEKQRQDLLGATNAGIKPVGDAESEPLLQLQSQLQANQVEIANHERAIAGVEARINEYQQRLNAEPETEQQLAELSRGYEQTKANYDDLSKKKNQSVMATSMERMQQGERFTMLDPPSLPTKPDYPNRMKFCAMGIATGLGLGFLVVILFEFFDDRMHEEKEIKDLLATRILAEIPEIQSKLDERMQKRRTMMGWGLAVIVVLIIAAGSTVSFLRG